MNNISKPLIKKGLHRAILYVFAIFGLLLLMQPLSRKLLTIITGEANPPADEIGNFILLYGTSGAGIMMLTFAFRVFIDKSTFFSLGFQWKGFESEALMGFFSGPLLLGIGSLMLMVAGYITFSSLEWAPYALFLQCMAMIMVSIVEETMFRGYLLNNLLQSLGKWPALIASAVLFGLLHSANPDVSILAIVNILVAGLFLGLNYIYTKNLWFGILFHFSWNFFQGPVYGFEVSGLKLLSIFKQSQQGPVQFTGGAFGFEGSVMCPLLLATLFFILAAVFTKRYLTPEPLTGSEK